MRTKELKGLCANLAEMACSGRMAVDFESLAGLPDGEIVFDLIQVSVRHSAGGALHLQSIADLADWLHSRLASVGCDPGQVKDAQVLLTIDTSTPPTNRATCVSFRFSSTATLATNNRRYEASASNHLWHNRPPNKSVQTDRATPDH